jgi:aspartate carbamoyltransferase catalytic subunit
MPHCLQITDFSQAQISELLNTGLSLKKNPHALASNRLSDEIVATVFFEPSTRTQLSFQIAAERLGARTVHIGKQMSSLVKGESLLDTIYTLEALGARFIVLRHPDDDVYQQLMSECDANVALLNAGNGQRAHPTQAFTDALTIVHHKSSFENLNIAIVGDIAHSRVAFSNEAMFQTMGVKQCHFVAPEEWLPQNAHQRTQLHTDLDPLLSDLDVIMCLRVQNERIAPSDTRPTETSYHQQFGLTEERAKRLKPDCLIMHPGPMNRGVEINSAVADSSQSVITEQVQNGVIMRMVLLDYLAKGLTA